MQRTPSIDKLGGWLVIVVSDSKGRISAHAVQGRDPDPAFAEIAGNDTGAGGVWMVHWEKGFQTIDDAENRACEIELDLNAKAGPDTAPIN